MHSISRRLENRIVAIDIVRGLVMVIMALDHVREFFHITAMTADPLNLQTTTPVLFFTRWITHFCAPTFVFLSGTSAFLSGRNKSKKALGGFLIKRGLWLVLVEMLIITLGLTFNPFYNFIIWQVIWAIGWSMVILGLLVRLPLKVITVTGLLLFFGHNLTDYISLPKEGLYSLLMKIFLTTRGTILPLPGGRVIGDFYAILPWTGVMLLGYAFGTFFQNALPAERRRKILVAGIATTALFIVLRFINQYGDPAHWVVQKTAGLTVLSFLNTSKYPCSLVYLCMTLGPALILVAMADGVQNRVTAILSVYGRVPFFYYVLHFYLAHILLVIAFFGSGYQSMDIIDPGSIFLFRPINFGYPLWAVYLVWLLVVATLYLPCKWFNRYKQAHSQWWVSYL